MRDRVYKGDTAIIEANLYDGDGVNPLDTTTVSYTVKKPDGTTVNGGSIILTQSEASIPFTDTTVPGVYNVQVKFVLATGAIKSTVLTFEVVDPLETTTGNEVGVSDTDKVVDRAWMKLEDLFDSELGGPHLRDRTLAGFDREKMKRFLPDALYNINSYYQPTTGYSELNFPYSAHAPLLSQGLLLEAIFHLKRSYVEQPLPSGAGQPSYFDRRDYLSRWDSVLTSEETRFNMWLDLFKRDAMAFGQSSLLVGGYSNHRYPRYMSGRYPYVYRW